MPEVPTKSGLVAVTHWTGSQRPTQVEQAMAREGMGWSTPFGPGRPLNPYAGSGKPRSFDYASGYNIATRPSVRDGRVSFIILKGIIDSWDIARIAIGHRIDDVRSLDWSVEAAPGVTEDVTTALEFARAKLKYPEGPGSRLPFRAWLAKFLEGILRYDAGSLYRRRNRAGGVIGLQVVSGVTIAPVLDEYGGTPEPPAPAYLQYIKGYPHRELTVEDLIYVPFRPQDDSPYGFAPLESVLMTANTDLRMQQFFLGRFTEGNIPEGFATTPEGFTPDQIDEWQQHWDAFLYGDMERLASLKWVPFGTKFEWAKDWKFDRDFQEFLITKTAAAFHVTPADLGFTNDVNRSTSESQEDINFRVGTLPLVQHVQDILDAYLQEDLGLPVSFRFDTGMDKEDRLQVAQANKLYVEMGALSPDEVREADLGLPIDNKRPVSRFVMHSRRGPIPLLDIVSAGGKIDGETFGPADDQVLVADPVSVAAVLPEERTAGAQALLAQDDKAQAAARSALHPGVPPLPPVGTSTMAGKVVMHPAGQKPPDRVAEALKAALTAGVTSATGVAGNPLHAGSPDGDEMVRKAFYTVDEVREIGRQFAEAGQFPDAESVLAALRALQGVVKAAPTVAGLAVKAADTGRVLLLQRALCDDDPAAGTWELPGGHIEDGETPLAGACREWAEEVGCTPPPGVEAGSWTSPNGVYQGIVWVVPSEADLTINLDPDDRRVLNPDDPDGDQVETVAWFAPDDLPSMPSLRQELVDSADTWLPVIQSAAMSGDVRKALRGWRDNSRARVRAGKAPRRFEPGAVPAQAEALVWPLLEGARTRGQVDAAFGRVVKAGKGNPRRWRELAAPDVPQRKYDLAITDHYAPQIQDALARMWPAVALQVAAQAGTLDLLPDADTAPLRAVLDRLWADAWATGKHGAEVQVRAVRVRKDDGPAADVTIDWGAWEPGNLPAALLSADGGFRAAIDDAGITLRGITDTGVHRMGTILSEGLLNGDSVDTIGRALREVTADPDRAEMIAHTETARMQTLASMDLYASEGIRQWDWLTTDGACPKCADMEARNPHGLGDTPVPLHPRCRCAAAPVWQSME